MYNIYCPICGEISDFEDKEIEEAEAETNGFSSTKSLYCEHCGTEIRRKS